MPLLTLGYNRGSQEKKNSFKNDCYHNRDWKGCKGNVLKVFGPFLYFTYQTYHQKWCLIAQIMHIAQFPPSLPLGVAAAAVRVQPHCLPNGAGWRNGHHRHTESPGREARGCASEGSFRSGLSGWCGGILVFCQKISEIEFFQYISDLLTAV